MLWGHGSGTIRSPCCHQHIYDVLGPLIRGLDEGVGSLQGTRCHQYLFRRHHGVLLCAKEGELIPGCIRGASQYRSRSTLVQRQATAHYVGEGQLYLTEELAPRGTSQRVGRSLTARKGRVTYCCLLIMSTNSSWRKSRNLKHDQ